jgi:hypothetical protein
VTVRDVEVVGIVRDVELEVAVVDLKKWEVMTVGRKTGMMKGRRHRRLVRKTEASISEASMQAAGD